MKTELHYLYNINALLFLVFIALVAILIMLVLIERDIRKRAK